MTRRYADLSASRLAELLDERSILVQPVGAIEQHGAHLPLSTDTLVAEAIATAAVDRAAAAGVDAWLLPTLAVSKSDEHAWSPGTLWLSVDTLLAVLRDIGRSVSSTGAKKLVFVNGHGGNSALLQVATRELRRLFGLQPFAMPLGAQRAADGQEGRPDELGFGIHAGWSETSVVMHLAPHLVDESAFARSVPEPLAGFELLGFNGRPVSFGWLSNDFDPSGVIGDPSGASAEAGALIFSEAVTFVTAALREVDRFPLLP